MRKLYGNQYELVYRQFPDSWRGDQAQACPLVCRSQTKENYCNFTGTYPSVDATFGCTCDCYGPQLPYLEMYNYTLSTNVCKWGFDQECTSNLYPEICNYFSAYQGTSIPPGWTSSTLSCLTTIVTAVTTITVELQRK